MNVKRRPKFMPKLPGYDGKYQYDCTVRGANKKTNGERVPVKITVFCDDKEDARRAACAHAEAYGYEQCTTDRIVQRGAHQ